jgi:hypothetical protein
VRGRWEAPAVAGRLPAPGAARRPSWCALRRTAQAAVERPEERELRAPAGRSGSSRGTSARTWDTASSVRPAERAARRSGTAPCTTRTRPSASRFASVTRGQVTTRFPGLPLALVPVLTPEP